MRLNCRRCDFIVETVIVAYRYIFAGMFIYRFPSAHSAGLYTNYYVAFLDLFSLINKIHTTMQSATLCEKSHIFRVHSSLGKNYSLTYFEQRNLYEHLVRAVVINLIAPL